jgi:hypothetical protein
MSGETKSTGYDNRNNMFSKIKLNTSRKFEKKEDLVSDSGGALVSPKLLFNALLETVSYSNEQSAKTLRDMSWILVNKKVISNYATSTEESDLDEAIRVLRNGVAIELYYHSANVKALSPSSIVPILTTDDFNYALGIGPELAIYDQEAIEYSHKKNSYPHTVTDIILKQKAVLLATCFASASKGLMSLQSVFKNIRGLLPQGLYKVYLNSDNSDSTTRVKVLADELELFFFTFLKENSYNPLPLFEYLSECYTDSDSTMRSMIINLFSTLKLSVYSPESKIVYNQLWKHFDHPYVTSSDFTAGERFLDVSKCKTIQDFGRTLFSVKGSILLSVSSLPELTLAGSKVSKMQYINDLCMQLIKNGIKVYLHYKPSTLNAVTSQLCVEDRLIMDYTTMEGIYTIGVLESRNRSHALFSTPFLTETYQDMLTHQCGFMSVLMSPRTESQIIYEGLIEGPLSIRCPAESRKSLRSNNDKEFINKFDFEFLDSPLQDEDNSDEYDEYQQEDNLFDGETDNLEDYNLVSNVDFVTEQNENKVQNYSLNNTRREDDSSTERLGKIDDKQIYEDTDGSYYIVQENGWSTPVDLPDSND